MQRETHPCPLSVSSSPEQEQESLHQAEQRCIQLEAQVVGLEERLEQEEGAAAQLASQRHRLEAECCSLRRDLEELENTLTSVEEDKQVGPSWLQWRDCSYEVFPCCKSCISSLENIKLNYWNISGFRAEERTYGSYGDQSRF